MNWLPRILLTVLVATAIVIFALWLTHKPAPATPSTAAPPEANPPTATSPERSTRPPSRATKRPTTVATTTNSPSTGVILNWEKSTEDILSSPDAPEEQGRRLFALFGRFPPEGQAETAQHIANLLADEDYRPFGLHLADTNTTPEVQEVILADVLARPNALKLPLLLEVAKVPEHPKAAEARELLLLYLEKDYGDDWPLWDEKIAEWLKENPDAP